MQRVDIIALGKTAGFYKEGVAEYTKRLQRHCRFTVTEIAEEALDEKAASPAAVQAALEKEGARVLAAMPKGARLVALCVEGYTMTSPQLAAFLDEAAQAGAPVAFAIGSSHGLGESVKQAAALRLSLSAMTLPHQLARLVLAEQVYRAFMIRQNTKYHK